MRRAVVTGAAGFIGRCLCGELMKAGWKVTAAIREERQQALPVDRTVIAGDLATYAGWDKLFSDADCVFHLAARTHRMRESGRDILEWYRRDNESITRRLAQAASASGVRRFVFLSSVKAMGEERARPYSEDDVPRPSSPYGISKLEAERALQELGTDLDVVIVRPPLVYGPGGKGNIPRLARLARLGARIPLPFGAVVNRRSLIFVGNLANLLITAADHPMAEGGVFLVADEETPSTLDLLRRIAAVQGRRFKAIPFSVELMRRVAHTVGYGGEAARLFDTLVVETTHVRRRLGWSPPFTLTDGLRATFGGPRAGRSTTWP